MRLAVSKDKQGVLTLAHEGQQVQTPEDVVKNTYTLEFLGIEEKKQTWAPCGDGHECRCHDAYQTHGYRNPNKYQ
jgi:hypothetical protein